MSFLRPEAVAWLRRYGETALAGLLALWLAWQGLSGLLAAPLVGTALVAAAFAAALWAGTALSRARLAAHSGTGQDPGVVEIAEGRIGYFGPEAGGLLALDEIAAVAVEADGRGGLAAWVLIAGDGRRLRVPARALGAGRLPDALAALPGFDAGVAVARSGESPAGDPLGSPAGNAVIWRRAAARRPRLDAPP